MFKVAVEGILIVVLFCTVACIKEEQSSKASQARQITVHGTKDDKAPVSNGLVDVLKGKSLTDFPAATIGQAFDGYAFFSKKEWRETRTSTGKAFVDFNGWFKSNSTGLFGGKGEESVKGIQVKFAVYPDGSYGVVMASKIVKKADGTDSYEPIPDSKSVLDKIYANKEISF